MKREQRRKYRWVAKAAAPYAITLLCLAVGNVHGQTQFITPDPIVFPLSGQNSYVLSSGQSLVARSGQSVTLNAGTTVQSGATALFEVDPTITGPINNNPNAEMNWILNRSFNATGQLVSESKVFYDDMGRVLQSQNRNLEAGLVIANEPLYSVSGALVGSTLPAPIGTNDLLYKTNFFTNGNGTAYNFRNFGRYLNSAGTKVDKTSSGDAVNGSISGTVGWYYSASNNLDTYQDITTHPYTLGTDASNGTSIFRRIANAGNELRMGKNREAVTFSVPVTKELELYENIRSKYFTDAEVGGRAVVDSAARIMMVNLDADRNVGVSIYIDGKPVLSALGGADLTVAKTVSVAANSNAYFPVLTSQSVNFSGTASSLVNYVSNEAVSSVSTGAVTLGKGLYELRTTTSAQTVSYNLALGTILMNFYDQLGRLRASIPPEGVKKLLNGGLANYTTLASVPFTQTFEYNAQGLLAASVTPDQGRSEFKYNTEGKVRFSQNALQKQKGSYSFTNYDSYGRVLQTGEYLPTGTGIKFENITVAMLDASGLPSVTGTQSHVSEIQYDVVNATHGVSGYVQDSFFLGGAVSYSAKYSQLTNNVKDPAKLVSRNWYNYDGDGNLLWAISNVNGLGNKTMDYNYDEFGRVTKSIYQKNNAAETFVHYYEYNLNGKLKTVYTNTADVISSRILHAKYIYALTGALKRIEYGDKLQGVDYVYTVDGKLKSINNANVAADGINDPGKDGSSNGFSTDVFSMNMEYYTNDYLRAGTNINGIQNSSAPRKYSGLVNGIGWHTQKPSSVTGLDDPVMNIFTYDTKGQLLSNIWGTPDYGAKIFTGATNVNQEKGISYDGNGNLIKLQRTNGGGTVVNNFTYNYQAGTNRLSSVAAYATYGYDAIGQLTSQVKGNAGSYLDYDVFGKVTAIYSDAVKSTIMLSFAYDEGGNRIMKKDHRTNSVNWYVYDAEDNLVAIYESKSGGELRLAEQPIYGAGKLGILNRPGLNYSYTLTDHLGNTRAIINRTKLSSGLADVQYYADYYSFGMEARSAGIDSRYGYQGLYAEKDKETGWNNFELRNYDASIGRWLTADPAGQYVSPYVGMGNNPISGVDPDGSWNTWLGAFAYSLTHGGKVKKTEGGFYQVSKVENNMLIVTTAAKGGGNGFMNFSSISASQQQQQRAMQASQSWAEKAFNAFRDWGSDHPYFHGVRGEEYSPAKSIPNFEVSGGLKISAVLGVSGGPVNFQPLASVWKEVNISTRMDRLKGNNFKMGESTASIFGVSALGLSLGYEKDFITKDYEVGISFYGLGGKFKYNKDNLLIDWFFGFEQGVSAAAGLGIDANYRVGISKQLQ
ncbi:hypothetical protein GCM10009120_26750 [Sphingobacterium siyangense subsp. cladoniae]|uniref:RHS repeat domain-containing protein n=1 Tax=Sphingobacterium siyangense TaxID=459529 RepID=UPI0031F78C16